jgi:polar amino acid transport system substrate-binding protein
MEFLDVCGNRMHTEAVKFDTRTAMTHFRCLPGLLLAFLLLPPAAQAQSGCGAVRIAFNNALAPFAIEATGNGIEVDIVRESLRRQGCTLEPVFLPFVRFGYALVERKVDGVATINERSGIEAAFSDTYIEYHNVAVTLQSRHLAINRIADLKGLKVIAFPGASLSLGDEYRRFTVNNRQYSEEQKQLSHNRLLYNGGVDVAVAERSIYAYLDRTLDDSKFSERKLPVVLHPLFAVNRYQVGFRDPALRDKFNLGLSSLSKEDLKRIHDRYR